MGELEGLQLGRGDQESPLFDTEIWDILEGGFQQLLRQGDVQRRLGEQNMSLSGRVLTHSRRKKL